MQNAIIRNDFHGTSYRFRFTVAGHHTLCESQVARARKRLCGMQDCSCGTVRGPQYPGILELWLDATGGRTTQNNNP